MQEKIIFIILMVILASVAIAVMAWAIMMVRIAFSIY